MKKLLSGLFVIAAASASAGEFAWPKLPNSAFISGRASEKGDVAAGNAVFVAAVNGVSIGKPIEIEIPQYAFHIEAGIKTPVIVVQAESAQGQKIIGARNFDGAELAGLIDEFELLGIEAPK